MIGFWATLSLNMPDFTRFGKSQREQVVGQTVALPTTMVVFRGDGHSDHFGGGRCFPAYESRPTPGTR